MREKTKENFAKTTKFSKKNFERAKSCTFNQSQISQSINSKFSIEKEHVEQELSVLMEITLRMEDEINNIIGYSSKLIT